MASRQISMTSAASHASTFAALNKRGPVASFRRARKIVIPALTGVDKITSADIEKVLFVNTPMLSKNPDLQQSQQTG